MIRPYLAMFAAQVRLQLQYRSAAIAGMVTQIFFGLIRVQVLAAFYQHSSGGAPMSLAQAEDYVWLSQATLLMLPWRLDPELRAMIKDGSIASELLRPVDSYWLWLSRATAQLLVPTLLRGIPLFALAWACGWLRLPGEAGAAALWLCSLLPALVLSAAITCLLTISLMWTVAGEGITVLAQATVWTLSGIALPLPLFPDWLQPALAFLPFRAFFDTPAQAYTGLLTGPDYLWAVGHQLAWGLVAILAGRLLTSRGLTRLTIAGG